MSANTQSCRPARPGVIAAPKPERGAAGAHSRSAARKCNLEFLGENPALRFDFRDAPPAPRILLASRRALPLKHGGARVGLNAALFSPAQLAWLSAALGPLCKTVGLMRRQTVIDMIGRCDGARLARRAAFGLRRLRPRDSAAAGLETWQAASLAAAAAALAVHVWASPRDAAVTWSLLLTPLFLLATLIRAAAAFRLLRRDRAPDDAPCCSVNDPSLPVYTVLAPVHREERVLAGLVSSLKRLRYPADKLDIKIIVEAGDAPTLAAARALDLEALNMDLIVTPRLGPQTKPKALNYALPFAAGDYLVIYDAEDRPDPWQLLKAVARFRAAPPETACLQASLAFHNDQENWLSRQFAIEYASLFDGVLPLLAALRLPLPLGGTSNHFRMAALKAVGAWDPHNVTEDADLGVRLHRAGHRTETLASTTYEEAACSIGGWLGQRRRWLKGWLITYGVHMRRPTRLLRELGPAGFLAFQGYFAGAAVSALLHLFFLLLLLRDLALGVLFSGEATLLGAPFWLIACFNFIGGYATSFILGWSAVRARRLPYLAPHAIFIPAYWLLVFLAAWLAVFQLVRAPFYWEKTEHGLSRMGRPEGGRRRAPSS